MAARKRKIVQPKQAAEAEMPIEATVAPTEARESNGAADDDDPSANADAEIAAEPAESIAPPPESGESDALTLKPAADLDELSDGESDDDSETAEHGSDPTDDERRGLIGEGPSDVDETRVDDTGAYLKGLLEALLFVSDHPLEIKDLARAAKIDKKRAEELVQEIRVDYEKRGVRLDEVGDGFAFRSNPAYSEYVRGYLSLRPVRLSRAQLETLSIVAYRQPITRPEVDDIRGVDAGPVLKGLLERDLVRIIGKKDEPGRPMLYGTTQTFLQVFSLKSLRDLPTLREFTELNDESRKTFEEELGEEAPEGPVSFEQAMAADAAEASDEALAEPSDADAEHVATAATSESVDSERDPKA